MIIYTESSGHWEMIVNDEQIRLAFHQRYLRKHHPNPAIFVVDELGLQHGKCRADIAVIDGNFIGYEIKSEVDSLRRLNNQIEKYNAVFDLASLIVADRHLGEAMEMLPRWWGIIAIMTGPRGVMQFRTVRTPERNRLVKDYAVAELLWRNEAKEILVNLGFQGSKLRERRSELYDRIVAHLDPDELRRIVGEYLKKRGDWRHRAQPFRGDGSSQLVSRS